MMASYRFALFCNRSCSLGPSLSPHLLSLQEKEEGKLLYVLVAGPKDCLCAKSSRLCLWAMQKKTGRSIM